MRSLGVRVLFMVAAFTLVFLGLSSCSTAALSDSLLLQNGENIKIIATNRKLKENSLNVSNSEVKNNPVTINMEDYPQYDPVPISKAAIKPGPIEHGTPLMPYLPSPAPAPPTSPGPPKRDGLP